MNRYADVTQEVDTGPSGADIAAFFDVDRTLFSQYTAVAFFMELLRSGNLSPAAIIETVVTSARFELGNTSFEDFFEKSTADIAGKPIAELDELGRRLFEKRLGQDVYPESRALVKAHQRKGHTIVMLTSATEMQVRPLAEDLGIENVICNELEVIDGLITGKAVEPIIYGTGKLDAAEEFSAKHDIDLGASYFYSDGSEDIPLLERVGRPRPLNPDRKLRSVARKQRWPARDFKSRGRPGAADVVRTGLIGASFFGAMAAAAPVAIMNRSLSQAKDVSTATFGDFAVALSGIDLHVTGEENVWKERPVVFVFNHQSYMDTPILVKLVRGGITGLAKKELQRNPVFGPVFSAAGVIFVDRFDHEKAMQAMQPALDALEGGTSLVIAPEGHRQATPRIGPFKKGAFHLAMQAGVPIVPVAMRNPLDAMPRGHYVVRPARVDVAVHAPIPTDSWRPDSLDAEIAAIRQWFVDFVET